MRAEWRQRAWPHAVEPAVSTVLSLREISSICMTSSCTCVYLPSWKAQCLLSFWPKRLITKCDEWWGSEDEGRGGRLHTIDLGIKATSVHLKKKKSAPLHSREEQYAVMMLTQVWSMCTFPPQSACPEREVCVCGCFILRRSVHNKQSDRGLQRELKYTKALRKCLNNVA